MTHSINKLLLSPMMRDVSSRCGNVCRMLGEYRSLSILLRPTMKHIKTKYSTPMFTNRSSLSSPLSSTFLLCKTLLPFQHCNRSFFSTVSLSSSSAAASSPYYSSSQSLPVDLPSIHTHTPPPPPIPSSVSVSSSDQSSSSSAAAVAAAAATTSKSNRITTSKKRDAIAITPRAAQRIQTLLAQQQQTSLVSTDSTPPTILGIRLGVRRRGCNGLSYTLNYAQQDDMKQIKGMEVVSAHGVSIFIEPMALLNVVGTTMDYVETDLSSEFIFENPNSKGTCGCGESFNV